MPAAENPHWAMSKSDQKRVIEYHLRDLLRYSDDLLPHERFFLAEAIGLTGRGQFGMARAALRDAYEDASQFDHYAMDPNALARATPVNLRAALQFLENSPAQEYPIFR